MDEVIAEQMRKASTQELLDELKRRREPALRHCATEELEEELKRREKRRWDGIRSLSQHDQPPKLVEK